MTQAWAFAALILLAGLPAHGQETAVSAQSPDAGHGSQYCDRKLGIWFYCHDDEAPRAPRLQASPAPGAQSDEADIEAAERFKAEMERARLVAVWNPTEANVRRYFAFEQRTLDKSGTFADVARRLVWADPRLDYTLQRPIGEAAKTEWIDARNTDRDLFFRGIYDQIGIFYIYRGACAPCRAASPIVRAFGQRFGVVIKPISTDGTPNPEFDDFAVDRGQLKAWGITAPVTPAYMIFQKPSLDADGRPRQVTVTVGDGKILTLRPCDNAKGCLTYLGAGVLSVDEIADRLFIILATQPGQDF